MTYSIIARDSETGAFGIGCQSHFFGVGRLVGWLEPGVGVVATQAFVNVGFGPRGIDMLRNGSSAQATVAELISDDDQPDFRQLAAIDSTGSVANFTGVKCVEAAGALSGDQVSVQGNMLASPRVWESMLEAYEIAVDKPFAWRLHAALRAAEDNGGDARGSQSAVIKVVSGKQGGSAWEETLVDIRVDDHPDPVTEIGRLLGLNEAFNDLGGLLFEPGVMIGEYQNVTPNELASALGTLESARTVLGDNQEAAFWKAVLLARSGSIDQARDLFRAIFTTEPHWAAYLSAIAQVGFLPPELAQQLRGAF